MTRNLLITGVAGFIGRQVAAEALRRGYRVSGLDRNQAQVQGIEFLQADIRDRDRMIAAMRDKDAVIHLAAVTSNVEFIKDPIACYETNANGFLNVAEAAVKSGCQRLVYASSAAVYLDHFSEEAAISFQQQSNHYAKTKMMNEMLARSYEDIHGIRTIGLRYFNVYGDGENAKGDYASIITILRRAKRAGEWLVLYGDGRQARDLINVRDAAQITVDLLEKGSHPIYNVGTGVATAYVTIAEMIDKDRIRYVPNPLSSYQYYTRAETGRLRETLGDYPFVKLEKGIADLKV